jgi:hypothetical protein
MFAWRRVREVGVSGCTPVRPQRSALSVLRGKPGRISWHGRRADTDAARAGNLDTRKLEHVRSLSTYQRRAEPGRLRAGVRAYRQRCEPFLRQCKISATSPRATAALGHSPTMGSAAFLGSFPITWLQSHALPAPPPPLRAHASTRTQARARTRSHGPSTQEHARASRKLLRQCARIGTPAAVFLHRYYVGRGKARTALGASLALSDGYCGVEHPVACHGRVGLSLSGSSARLQHRMAC